MTEKDLVIQDIFSDTASKFQDKPALQLKKDNQWQKFTYKDLEIAAHKVANFLLSEGLNKGDCAAIILENRPEWAMIYFGMMYAGLTCVPLDPQLTPSELKNLLIDSATKIIFCSYDVFSKKLSPDLPAHLIKIVVLDTPDSKEKNFVGFSEIENIKPAIQVLPITLPEDIASLIYTSGTTAEPKGVLLTHKNICANFRSIEKLNICSPSDNTLSILPLYHTYAFMVTLITPLFLGAKITYCPLGFDLKELTIIIKEAEVTVVVGVPRLFSLLHKAIAEKISKIPSCLRYLFLPWIRKRLKRQFGRSLRLLVSGGARLEPRTGRNLSWLLGLKIIEGYGLTETSPVVTLNPPRKIKFGSVGKAIPDVQLKILAPDKAGRGEVLIKGPNVMLGYFKQPQLTASVIKDGWFYSGDLGYLDKEGYLFLVGREKELIVLSSGKNIYPEELEEYYSQASSIKELCIICRKEKSFGHFKDSLYAIIVPNFEFFQQKKETNIRQRIRWDLENLQKNLPTYKHIMGFALSKEELPRTVLKKIKRFQVIQQYAQQRPPEPELKERLYSKEDLSILSLTPAKKLIQYVSGEVNRPVYLDSHLEIDLGIDSLSRVELVLGIESLLKIKIPDTFIYQVATIKELITGIRQLIQEPVSLVGLEERKSWAQLLVQLPPKSTLKKIRLQARPIDRLLTWIFKKIYLFFFRVFWFLRIEGIEHLPLEGPYLICPNHASYLDGLLVFSSLSLNSALNTYFLGFYHIFSHPLLRWANKIARLIPIDSELHLNEALQATSFLLSHNKIVCVFPEGQRSIDGKVKEFKKGAGILIKELDIPVVPVYIKGSHQAWSRGILFPRPYPLKIVFGRALSCEELINKGKKRPALDDYEAIVQALREEVLKLLC